MLGSEELFFPITRKWSGTFKQVCHLPTREELLKKVENIKKAPQVIKGLCSVIIKGVSTLLNTFLLWGTEDSDLTIEEEVRMYVRM